MTARSLTTAEQLAAEAEEEQAQLALEAYLLRQQGKSWWDIAEALHLSEAGASNAVARGMQRSVQLVSEHAKRMLLTLEVDRLDTLMASHWQAATSPVTRVDRDGNQVLEPPDVRAGEFILKVIAARVKLLELDVPEVASDVRTVVVAGNGEEYVAALRLIASHGRIIPGEVVEGG